MKNFDSDRQARKKTKEERTFQLHGETFIALPTIHPDVLVAYDAMDEDSAAEVILSTVDKMIVEMIEPDDDSAARWHAIRADKADPIDLDDIMDLVQWLLEVQTRRPIGQPSGSSPGRPSTPTSSTDGSSSPAVRAA